MSCLSKKADECEDEPGFRTRDVLWFLSGFSMSFYERKGLINEAESSKSRKKKLGTDGVDSVGISEVFGLTARRNPGEKRGVLLLFSPHPDTPSSKSRFTS